MQLVRKNKTIQQDKLRALQTCFLANLLQDYYHNLAKHNVRANAILIETLLFCIKDQLKRFEKMENFQGVDRDPLTHRADIHFKQRYCRATIATVRQLNTIDLFLLPST